MGNIVTARNRGASASSRLGDEPVDWNPKHDLHSDLSAATATFRKDYDVFLSFRGEDTRYSFTSHLFTALTNAGFSTYIDEERLEKGETIGPGLMEAIERSKISIIVFSENYAGSTWCLDELTEILKCRNEEDRLHLGQIVLPIFYGIAALDVRKQGGPFDNAFAIHELRFESDLDKVKLWRSAFYYAGNLNGWEEAKSRNKADLIKDIVRDVSRKLSGTTNLSVACPVGTDSHVQELKKDYDVFLCFRGIDTRHNFTAYLYNALTDAGFSTFMDLEVLEKGDEISLGLLIAIERSKISIVVFSSNYANSRWCLGELSMIMECRRTLGQKVLPIFYGIEPTDVRKQGGHFAHAFMEYEVRFRTHTDMVQRWRLALTDVANLSGWDAKIWR